MKQQRMGVILYIIFSLQGLCEALTLSHAPKYVFDLHYEDL